MKKIITFSILFTLILFLTSCEDHRLRNGREMYMLYLNKTLKDPESLKIYSEKYTFINDVTVEWVVDYGAKNSFGGMVRNTLECETLAGVIFVNIDGKEVTIFRQQLQ